MSRLARTRLGVAAFLGAAALVLTAVLLFLRYPTFVRGGAEYRTLFADVAGLNVGDEVRFGGLLVGAVTALSLDQSDPARVAVRFRVRRGTPVRADTRAAIDQVGLLGVQHLSLRGGRPDAPLAQPGAVLPSEEPVSLRDAMVQVARVAQRADTLLGAVQRLADGDALQRIEGTLARLDTLLGDAAALVTTTSRSAERTMAQAERALARIDTTGRDLGRVMERAERLIGALDTTVASARPELATAQREAVRALREVRTLVSDLREALYAGGGVDGLMRDLAITSENLARLTTRLEHDPTSALKRRALPPKTAGPALR